MAVRRSGHSGYDQVESQQMLVSIELSFQYDRCMRSSNDVVVWCGCWDVVCCDELVSTKG